MTAVLPRYNTNLELDHKTLQKDLMEKKEWVEGKTNIKKL